ncbi:MAG: 50S ribosomal protein L25, partial [Candidatus Portnoybacteria bacterium CG10_big_fil_rev_8_21_14_0_10_36_7]
MSTELKAKNRDLNSKLNALRRDGFVPAILYGHDVKNAPLSVSAKEFEEVLKQAGESTLVDLTIEDKKPVKILIHDVTRDPVSSDPIHIDFYQVNMKEKIKTQIALVFVGESLAVKEMGGVLVKNAHEV